MQLSWLDKHDSWLIVLLLLVAMLLSAEIACLVGRRLSPRAVEASKGHFFTVVGSLLGLLALLVSFTFSMATQRYEARRLTMLEDVNAIGTFYLRTCLLPEEQRGQIKPLLKQYLDLRPQTVAQEGNAGEFETREDRSRALLLEMWGVTRDMARAVPEVKGSDNAIRALIELAASHTRRLSALVNRVPDTVIWMLLGAAIVGMAVIGYSAGLGNHRGMPARIMLSVLVCGTIYVVFDLDRPHNGVFQVDQAPIIRLQRIIAQDPETRATP